MNNPSPFTFVGAVLAGRASPNQISDWVDVWHDSELEADAIPPLHEFLGLTQDQYSRWVQDDSSLASILNQYDGPANGADIDQGPFKVAYGIPAKSQESNFMNATLSSAKDGISISVAVTPPDDLDLSNPQTVNTMLRAAFRRLIDTGWQVEIQIGPDEDSVSDADRAVISQNLKNFIEASA